MDIIKNYGNIIKKNIITPSKALKLVKLGLSMENIRVNKFKDKNLPKAFQYLNKICLKFILDPLKNPQKSCWTNLFSPCEILHSFNINPLSIEAMSSFFSGLMCEDAFINYAERLGIDDTLCSYHKAFIGAVQSKIIPLPKLAITTTSICDANTNTFKYLCNNNNVPYYIIDVPYEYNKESEAYVNSQLKEIVLSMEDIFKKKFNLDNLKEVIKRENETNKHRKEYMKYLGINSLPTTLTLEMYMLFTSHMFMGKEETYIFYKMLSDEIKHYPSRGGKGIFWIHLIPFYHPILKEYFNLNKDYQLLGCDLNYDYTEYMDYDNPLEAISKKIILNHGNGPYERKIDSILNILDTLNADAVINFCHWGCRQSSGGAMLLKEQLKNKDIPYLSIDGDGIDRRNSHIGQMKTRLEAFLEIVNNKY